MEGRWHQSVMYIKTMRIPFSLRSLLLAVVTTLALAGCSPKGKKVKLIDRAENHFKAGQYLQAEPEFIDILSLDRNNAVAASRLGTIYFEQGRLELAVDFLRTAVALSTNDLDARVRLATIYLNLGAPAQAGDLARLVLDRRPGDEDAPMIVVECASNEKLLGEAFNLLQKLSPPEARKPACEVALAALHLRQGGANALTQANARLKTALELNPKLPALYSVLAALCRATNGLVEADRAYQTAAELSPMRSSRRLQWARFKLSQGDTDAGKALLKELTTKVPDFAPPWLELARLAADGNDLVTERQMLDEFFRYDPDNADGKFLEASLRLNQGDGAGAIAEYLRLLRDYPNSIKTRLELFNAYNSVGDIAAAAVQLHEILLQQPENLEANVNLARLDLLRGDFDAAVTLLTQIVAKRPGLLQPQSMLAQAYGALGELEKARGVYRQLQQLQPEEPSFHVEEGLVLLEQNKRPEARAAFEAALKLGPKYPRSLGPIRQLVGLDLLDQHADQALTRVTQLINEATNAPEPRLLMAEIQLFYHTPEGTNQAVATLLQATSLKSDFWPAYLGLAQIYHANRQYEKALADLQSVVRQNPNDKVAWMLMGIIQSDEKKYEAARDCYLKVLKIDPKFIYAINNLACLYSEHLHQPEQAYKLGKEARDLAPYEPATADTFGWVLLHKGQTSWALTLLEESASKAGRNAEVFYHLGMAQYAMMFEPAAMRSFKLALELAADKPFSGREEIQKRLAILSVDPSSSDPTPFENRIKEQPDDVVALGRLAAIYERLGQFEKSATTWQACLKANPENIAAMASFAGLLADHLNQFQKAYDLAQAAYKAGPDDVRALRIYGRLALRARDHMVAVSMLRDAVRINPSDPDLLFTYAEALYSVGEVKDAINSVRTALSRPGFKQAAEARLFLQMTDPASGNLTVTATKALETRPDYLPALIALAGQQDADGKLQEAVAGYEKALVLYPKFTPAVRRLAIIYSARPAEIKLASKYASRALEAYPGDPDLRKAAGLIAYQQAELKTAVNYLEEAMAVPGVEDAKARYYQGLAHLGLKNVAASRAALERAIQIGLAEPELTDAKRKLAELK